MASFTDRIPTFNPYVSQQPVDAMTQVGMAKQQQYNQNLQKIQQTMSSIGGLQIGRDVDKQYLEQKMGEMNKQLGVYASSDLSSGRLTSHLRSMVGGIANDEIVQNSVRSTMAAQAAKKLQAKYNEAGKGSPSNDWLLNTQLQKWYENPKKGASFNATYKPYQDYNAKALTVIKGVLEDENISEKDYYIDENNKVVFSDISVTTKVAGRAKEKIQTALMAQLSPGDWEQIQIDGRYQYSNMTGEQFQGTIEKQYGSTMKELNSEKTKLNGLYDAAKTIKSKEAIQQKIANLNVQIGKQTTEFKSISKYFQDENFEGAKAKLYSQNWMRNTSNAFSNSKTSETFKKSARADFKFERQKEQRRIWEYNTRLSFDIEKQKEINEIEREKVAQSKLANRLKLTDLGGYGNISGGSEKEDIFKITPGLLSQDINLRKQAIDNEVVALGEYFTKEEDYQKVINGPEGEYYKRKYPTYKDFAAEYMQRQEEIFKENPAGVSNKLREFFGRKQNAERVLNDKENIKNLAENVAETKFPLNDVISEEITLEDGTTTTLDGNEVVYSFNLKGMPVDFTKEEIVRFNTKWPKIKKAINFMPGTGVSLYNRDSDIKTPIREIVNQSKLTENEKLLLEITMKEKSDLGGLSNLLDENEQQLSNTIFDLRDRYNNKVSEIMEKRASLEEGIINNALTALQADFHHIPLSTKQGPNGTQMDQFKSVIEQYAVRAEKAGGLPQSPGITAEKLRTIKAKLDNAIVSVVKDEGFNPDGEDKYNITITDEKGVSATFRMEPSDYNRVFQNKFESSPELSRFSQYKKMIIANNILTRDPELLMIEDFGTPEPIGTTSTDGKFTNKNNAKLQGMDFPNVKLFGISANLVSQDGLYYSLEANIKNPISGKWQEGIELLSGELDVDMQVKMETLSDEVILQMILGHAPSAEEIKAFKDAAENIE